MRMLALLLIALLSASFVVGCDDDEAPATPEPAAEPEPEPEPAPEPEPEPHPLWGDWTGADELAMLQSQTWEQGAGTYLQTVEFDGETLRLTQFGQETEESTVEMVRPGVLARTTEEGGGTMTVYHAFAMEGDQLFLGMGISGAVIDGRAFVDLNGAVMVVDDGECKVHEQDRLGNFDLDGEEIECDVQEIDGQNVLTFTRPDGREISENQRVWIGETSVTDVQVRGSLLRVPEGD